MGKKSQKFIKSMSENFIYTKINDKENALEKSHKGSYRVSEIAKTHFTAEILSGSCVKHIAL
jgi:hypothetical protein